MLKNKLKYLALLLFTGVISILYDTYYTGIIFITLCILPVLLYGVCLYCKSMISVDVFSTVHIVNKGDRLPITVKLNNPTEFPISFVKIFLTYQNSYSDRIFKKNFIIPIDAKTGTSVTCTLYSECAGNLLVSVDCVRVFDYFKLFSLKKKVNKTAKVAILPRYYELTEFSATKNALIVESDSYHPTKKGDDPSEVFEIREYREGDRPQRIHWKLSSKVDQLMIKELSYPLNSSILIFLNLCVPKGETRLYYMDAILECALSISYTFVMKQQVHYICWSDEESGVCTRIRITQEEDLFEALNGLLNAVPYQNKSDIISSYLSQFPHEQYADTYFITRGIAPEWTQSFSMLKTQYKHILYLKDKQDKEIEASSKELLQQCEEFGIDTWSIDIVNLKQSMEVLTLG